MLVLQQTPLIVATSVTQSSAAWSIVASDGVLYATLAALTAAGKKPWPGLDPPNSVAWFSLSTADSTGIAAGGAFCYSYNTTTAPTDTARSVFVPAGQSRILPGPVSALWIRKVTAGDILQIMGGG